MKLSDIKGREAIELLADILEPVMRIFADKDIAEAWESNVTRVEMARLILKNHPDEVVTILKAMNDGEEPNVFTLPIKLIELMNDDEMKRLFTSRAQKEGAESSGSVMESTEAKTK